MASPDKAQKRLELQKFLETLTAEYVREGDKTKHVYFNPPTGMQLECPCIIYEEGRPTVYHADNTKYFTFLHWKLTTLTRDPEALDLAPKVMEIPRSYLDSPPYKVDGLVHHVFSLYW